VLIFYFDPDFPTRPVSISEICNEAKYGRRLGAFPYILYAIAGISSFGLRDGAENADFRCDNKAAFCCAC